MQPDSRSRESVYNCHDFKYTQQKYPLISTLAIATRHHQIPPIRYRLVALHAEQKVGIVDEPSIVVA